MGFRDWEKRLAGFWEGLFRPRHPQPLQLVEIARSLVREMTEKRLVSISRVYAPNVFTVALGSDDFARYAPLQAPFSRELEEYLRAKAEEKGFSLIGRPRVSFREDPTLGLGEVRVGAEFVWEEAAPPPEHTLVFGRRPPAEPRQEEERLSLLVVRGPDAGKRFPLERGKECKIGRRGDNTFIISDPTASREHVLVFWGEEGVAVRDLGSKNGTFINGRRVSEGLLRPGDYLSIGATTLLLEKGP